MLDHRNDRVSGNIPTHLLEDKSPELQRIIEWMLQPAPQDRFER